jgi:hypothetical protein
MKGNSITYIACATAALVFATFYTRKGNMACGAATAAFTGLKMLFNS